MNKIRTIVDLLCFLTIKYHNMCVYVFMEIGRMLSKSLSSTNEKVGSVLYTYCVWYEWLDQNDEVTIS
jgi:hypothetical protein